MTLSFAAGYACHTRWHQVRFPESNSVRYEDYRPRRDDTSMAYVSHAQSNQTARSQLAVDGKVEERELSGTTADLQSYRDRPDVLQSERSLLSNELPFVPWSLLHRNMSRLVHGGLLSYP